MTADERPRYPVGQRLCNRLPGSVSTIVADWNHHPDVARTASITDDRLYVVDVVDVGDHRAPMHQDVIEQACDPVEDEPVEHDRSRAAQPDSPVDDWVRVLRAGQITQRVRNHRTSPIVP